MKQKILNWFTALFTLPYLAWVSWEEGMWFFTPIFLLLPFWFLYSECIRNATRD